MKYLYVFLFLLICNLSYGQLSIVDQPSTTVSVDYGSNYILSISATGAESLNYQWKYNKISIYGETSHTLTLYNFGKCNEGFYSCLVSGDGLSIESTGTTVTLNTVLPVILSQSVNRQLSVGDVLSLSVSASGNNLKYKWFKDGGSVLNTSMIDSATSQTLVIPSFQIYHTGDYYCRVYNDKGFANSAKIKIRLKE